MALRHAAHTVYTRCIVEIDKSVQFSHATSASVAARVMHDIAKATTKDQRQAVAGRMNERLEVSDSCGVFAVC